MYQLLLFLLLRVDWKELSERINYSFNESIYLLSTWKKKVSDSWISSFQLRRREREMESCVCNVMYTGRRKSVRYLNCFWVWTFTLFTKNSLFIAFSHESAQKQWRERERQLVLLLSFFREDNSTFKMLDFCRLPPLNFANFFFAITFNVWRGERDSYSLPQDTVSTDSLDSLFPLPLDFPCLHIES